MKTVLIVEDEKQFREILEKKLTSEGFSVVLAEDGQQALDVLLKTPVDLILLDLLMPKMDGMTMLKKLRASIGKGLPVIILTNFDPNDQTLRDVVEYKPTYYLMKSNIKLESLVDHIKETLKLDSSQTTGGGS